MPQSSTAGVRNPDMGRQWLYHAPDMNADRIGLNFMRPDVGRPGNHDFVNSGEWLVSQFVKLGVKWNRIAFSWVHVQPEKGKFEWEPYDRVVDACAKAGIQVLATLGGHFDKPPVPAWAGSTLAEVIEKHPEHLEAFVEAWVRRYRGRIRHWEMLNEPRTHHAGMTVASYIEGVLKPGHRIVKSVDSALLVLPCAFDQLPVKGDKEDFWKLGARYSDIHNLHHYQDWGLFRTEPVAAREEASIRRFRDAMEKHGEGKKEFWVTEIGWWGTGSLDGKREFYNKDPFMWEGYRGSYTGAEILAHPAVVREDALRAEWMKDCFPRLLGIPGCAKLFLWVSMDEFEGGFDPAASYGKEAGRSVDLWGIIAGDRSWRKSAHAFGELLAR